jgi:two-component system, repressor protein LuxO
MLDKIKKILLVEDNLPLAETYRDYLKTEPVQLVVAETGAAALAALKAESFDAAILDVQLPDMSGIDVLRAMRRQDPQATAIVITAHGSINIAVEAMREGAFDFITKPFPAARLRVTLKNALERSSMRHEIKQLRTALAPDRFHDFIGGSTAMQAVYRTIDAVANSKASIFITGESGTGKELAARAIHQSGPRRNRNFIAINCGAIPRELLESHMFGHLKGAFTGAISDQIGAGKAADGGTLFLDEIAEMPLELQVKLLRFIQTGELQQLGSTKTEKVDVRFIAATNRDPMAEVKAGRFREDLYYRLHVIPLAMPPLREREEDILLLAQHFVSKIAAEEQKRFVRISPEILGLFLRHAWPGNVRQLENLLRGMIVLHDGEEISTSMLPAAFQQELQPEATMALPEQITANSGAQITSVPTIQPLWQLEKCAIFAALEACGQDVARAAAALEVSPSTLYRKLQNWKDGQAE